MTAILLIGVWVFADTRLGDFLATGTWLLGSRTGFELGMIAGMSLEMAGGLFEDFHRIRMASVQKGMPWSIKSILPAGRILISDTLRRADDTAEILAIRGYRAGGALCQHFSTPPRRNPCRSLCRCCSRGGVSPPLVNFLYFTDDVLRG